MKKNHLITSIAATTLAIGSAQAAVTAGIGIQFNDNEGGAQTRTVSVFAGNSFVTGWAFDGTTERTLSLGTVAEYNFFNEVGATNVIGSYASSGSRISVATTTDTGIANQILIAEAVYTSNDPTGGTPNFSTNTMVNGLGGSTTGTIDVTGLASGTLYFFYGTNGTRNTNFDVTQSDGNTVQIAGNAFWENTDTISAATPVSFTNDGTQNTISYDYTQGGAGKFMGVVLSDVVPIAPIPEPTTTALLGLGGLALILRRRK